MGSYVSKAPKTPYEIEMSLVRSHFRRFERFGELADLNKTIEHQSRALALTPDGDPDSLKRQMELYRMRFDLLSEFTDLEKAIEHGSHGAMLSPDGQPYLHGILGMLCGQRFKHLGELSDLDKGIEHASRAVQLVPDGDPDLPPWLSILGPFYNARFECRGEFTDLEKAIECELRALALTPDGDPEFPDRLDHLGMAYKSRFSLLGNLDDLEKAIEYGARAVALALDGDPSLSSCMRNLGELYRDRFGRLGELHDLTQAIEHETRALELTPEGHPHLPAVLGCLGQTYGDRFIRLGEIDDLEKGIEHTSRAIGLVPDGHPDLPTLFSQLGLLYSNRFRRLEKFDDLKTEIDYNTREPSDFEKAIEYQLRALVLTPNGHPSLPEQHSNIGASYASGYHRLGGLDALDKAIEHGARAVALTPDGHPNLLACVGNLGDIYNERFSRLGELDDLEKAIECKSRVVTLAPDEHPNLPVWLNSLGRAYQDQFLHLESPDILEKALEYESRAVVLTPDGHPSLPPRVACLGISYSIRCAYLGDIKDLEKGIGFLSDAVALASNERPDLPRWLNSLGISCRDRFAQLGELDDINKAIEYQSRALAITPDGHLDLYQQYHNLAISHLTRFERTDDPTHLQDSLDCISLASQSLIGPPRTMFQAALSWAKRITKHSSLQVDCIQAYRAVMDLLPRFIWLGATTNQRYEDLLIVESLAVDAAMVAIRSSDYALALEWLEHARCIVWNQNLMLRSPLDQLRSSQPTLAHRLQAVSNELYVRSSESRTSRALASSDSLTSEQVAQQHRRLAQEYSDLVSQARKIPQFEDFLQPMKADRLVRAAQYGPIVVVICHIDRCDALIISSGKDTTSHIPLPNYNQKKAQNARSEMEASLRRKGIRERGVKIRQPEGYKDNIGAILKTLWSDIVKPVLDFLGYTNDIATDNLPHITWCSTGTLSFLPLHAAGDYDQPRSRIFDYVVSSYIPTLTALLASSPSELNHSCRVLAIGQEATPGRSPLPGTSLELTHLKSHAENKVQYSQLMGNQATTTAVLDAMEQHDWVHLACHAHQNVNDSTKSGFFLHDGTLDLASINRRSFKAKGLAFLSACQTATGDEKLPDEAIHLASGMLMAGYQSVIATMWSVDDRDAPFVADKVYEQLMKDRKIGQGEAGRALHNAITQLRDEIGEREFGRWVPYIHIGS